jgi:hypothetical protein
MEVEMKIQALVLSLAFATFNSLAVDAPANFPKTSDEMAALATDFTKNAEVLKDPKKFIPFVAFVTEPGFLFAMSNQMLEPGKWAEMTNSIINPASYSAWMPLATDPAVYMNWMAAGMDSNFYTALAAQLSDPAKLMRWMMAPTDPKALEVLMKAVNPAVYLKWATAPADPRVVQTGMAPMNPNLYMGWAGAGMNPASYGNTWQGFATYPYAYPAGAAMPLPQAAPYGVVAPQVAPAAPQAAPAAPMPK